MKKLLLIPIVLFSFLSFAQEDYVKKANDNLERGNRRGAIEMATKAIEQNPNNNEALWIRVRALLSGDPREEQLNNAISDLNQMISSGVETAKVYTMLGVAEYELGGYIYRWKKAKENTGFSDDNSAYIKEQTAYYNEAVNHYESSIKAYKKAVEIDISKTESLTYKVKDAERYIQEVREKIKELK